MKRVGALPRDQGTTRGNSELPHVFLKHKNAKTYMQTKGNRDAGWEKKKVDSCSGRAGVESVVVVVAVVVGAYKPNDTLMVNGGLC